MLSIIESHLRNKKKICAAEITHTDVIKRSVLLGLTEKQQRSFSPIFEKLFTVVVACHRAFFEIIFFSTEFIVFFLLF